MKIKNKKILDESLERYNEVNDVMDYLYKEMEEDSDFAYGEQWPDDVLKERQEDGRVALTINRLPTFVNQVVNDARENRPQIKVRPTDDGVDVATAEIQNGLVRHIQAHSQADQAYDTAVFNQVTCGVGFFRIITEYCDHDSFEQEILVRRIDDPLNVKFPFHLCKEADYSDAPYAFVVSKMSKREFETAYPSVDTNDWESEDIRNAYISEDTVIVCEYWKIEEKKKTIYLLNTGDVVEKEDINTLPEGVFVEKERETIEKEIKWYLVCGSGVLDEGTFPGRHIPVIPVVGNENVIRGKKHFISLIRYAKDPQRMLNYWKSAETEAIALAPKSPYIAAEGQLEGYEAIWQESNRKNIPVLPYKPSSVAGTLLPAPQRVQSPQVPTGMVQAIGESVDDLKATMGIHDASLGSRGNETSGRAIIARQREGDKANFHFIDNLSRAIRLAGRIIVDIIPEIYDTGRAVRILGADMQDKVVRVNEQYYDEEKGEEVLYDLSSGKYDVYVDVGPSYQTKRLEAAESMATILQGNPNLWQIAGDILARNLDWPGSEELAERMVKMLPPNLQDDKKQEKVMTPEEAQQVAQDMAKMQQDLMQAEEAIQVLGQQNQELMQKTDEQAFQSQQNEADREADIAKETIRSQTDIQEETIRAEADIVEAEIRRDTALKTSTATASQE